MKKHLYKIWFIMAISSIVVLAIISKSPVIQIIASVCGVIYVLGVAKENRYAQLFGVVNTAIYGFLMIKDGLYGSVIYNLAYCIPMLIYTFITWGNKQQEKMVHISKYNDKKRCYIVMLLIALIITYYLIAEKFNINYALVDAITIIAGVFGMYNIAKKKIEQWYCWILVNAANAAMWYIKCTADISNLPMLIMWGIYLINNCYGLYIWNNKLKNEIKNIK